MDDVLKNFLIQGNNLVLLMDAMAEEDPVKFEMYREIYQAIRSFMEIIQFTNVDKTGIKRFTGPTSEIMAAIVIGKGKIDLRLLFEAMFETHSRVSMTQVSNKAGISNSTASNYRNRKKEITTDTWENLVNGMTS